MAKNNLNLKSIYGQKRFLLITLFILAISCSYGLLYPILIRNNFNSNENKISVSRQVINTIQWVNNTNFNSSDKWDIISVNQGSGSDVEGEINLSQEQANLKILGDEGEFINISGTPNPGEWNKTQNGNLIFPDNSGGDQYGFWADHRWDDQTDPNQSVSVHWDRIITLPVDMSDYNITSVSLDVLFNATVDAESNYLDGNIDVEGDTVGGAAWEKEYDYVRFYALISDIEKSISFELGYNQTTDLGRDFPKKDNITNAEMYVIDKDIMRSHLNTIIEQDENQSSFIFTLGMRVYCADNGNSGDSDYWEELRFLNCNFSFKFEKIIDRSTSISLKQSGPMINGTNVKINSANLSFSYKINKTWEFIDSPNSELRILINNKEHNERIKLTEIPTIFSESRPGGFNIANIINPYIELNLSIQIFLGDTFELNETVLISLDNITLSIQYTEVFSEIGAEPWYTSYLLYGGIILASIIGGSFLSYYFVFKYPKTVRKIRKFRKSLRKTNSPSKKVNGQKELFNSKYKQELKVSSKIRKIKPTKLKVGKSFKTIIILFVIINFLFAPLIITLFNHSNHQFINLAENKKKNEIGFSGEVEFTRNWLENSRFSTSQSWSVVLGTEGDSSDVSGAIEQNQANYLIKGNERTFIAAEGIPLSNDWNETINPNYPNYPDNYDIIENFGCFASHSWREESDQTPSIHWERIMNMPEDMSDKIITSVSMKTKVNATVTTDSGEGDDFLGIDTISDNPNNYATGDYVRFYVLFSDINNEVVFEVAYNQTVELGRDSPAKPDMMDTFLTNIPEEKLIEYLTNIFKRTSTSFEVTLGINIWCEDNYFNDRDTWDELWIKNFDLNITYAQKIDKFTTISFFQEGDKISGDNVRITEGNLRFKYKINDTWPELASPSSEIRILINGNPHTETIRLSSATGEFQSNNPDGYDVTDLLLKDININLSIQVYLADTFELNRAIKISIDDVYLEISYIDVIVDITREPWFNTALFIGIMAIAAVLGIYFLAYYRYLRFPLPIRKIRKYRSSLTSNQPPKGVLTPSREIAFNRKYTRTMGSSSKLLEGKSTESSLKIDILKDELK